MSGNTMSRKFHLTHNHQIVRDGYVNIDPISNMPGQLNGPVNNLDWLVDDAEATEIIAYRVLDHFRHTSRGPIIEGWARKLAIGGELTIVDLDLNLLIDGIMRGMDNAEVNAEFYGAEASPRFSKSTMVEVTDLLRSLGLKIVEQRYEERLYVVGGRRES